MTMTVAEGDIVRFIRSYADVFDSAIRAQRVTLSVSSSVESIKIYFDEEKLDNVFMNLFSNALKFTVPGGEIAIRIHEDEGNCLIEFEDTGIGIPHDKIGIIFDRFSQAGTDAMRGHEGTGIGLSLAKEFIEMHCGRITAESRDIDDYPEHHGTVFRISLPKGRTHLDGLAWVQFGVSDDTQETSYRKYRLADMEGIEGEDKADSSTAACREGKADARGVSGTILIVEDNPDMRKFLTSFLERQFAICCAVNGREGLEKAREMGPDLIITDVMMPVMSGYEMTKKIKEDPALKHIPVIMLTARAELTEKIEGMKFGADDYITKPFSLNELILRISALLNKQ
jgi:CheY-like chemotaxis protein